MPDQEILPPPRKPRTKRVMLAITDEEHRRFAALARKRGEPVAVLIRELALAALDKLGQR